MTLSQVAPGPWREFLHALRTAGVSREAINREFPLTVVDHSYLDEFDLTQQANAAGRLRRLPYSKYLKTDHWYEVRSRALKAAGYECSLCSSARRLQVHHRTYEHLGMEELSDLVVLCRDCHARHHDVIERQAA